MSQRSFLGRGWQFPVLPNSDRTLTFVDGPQCVERAIQLILDTDPGERIMRPTFGCGLRRYLMQPNTVAVRALLRHDVVEALANWEPRITVREVQVDPGDDPSLVLIRVSFVHIRDQRPGNLVYPFYLQ